MAKKKTILDLYEMKERGSRNGYGAVRRFPGHDGLR